MYNQKGDLIPIQINTAVGHNINDRVEDNKYIFDLSELKKLIKKHNFDSIFYIGNIIEFKNRFSELCLELGKSLSFFKLSPPSLTVPLIRDADDVLIVRSAYDTSAIIDDSYCRNRVEFLNMISDFNFGSEIAYINSSGVLINKIKTIPQNGKYPNFILKSIFPDYDRTIYPKLYRLMNTDEIDIIISTLSPSYFLMPFYYNSKKLYDGHIQNIRSLNILLSPDLTSIPIGAYTKITESSLNEYISDDSIVVKQRKHFLTTDDINIESIDNKYINKKIISKSNIINMNNILSEIGKKIIDIHS